MSKEEVFHRQLINSYIRYAANSLFEEFVVRSELISRTREFVGNMGPAGPQYARATTAIFFNGDKQAYEENLASVTILADNHSYRIQAVQYGSTTIKAIDL